MSRRERHTRVALDGLPEEQLSILCEGAGLWLSGKADDLDVLHSEADPERTVREVAALARLTVGLGNAEVLVPDRMVEQLIERRTNETRLLDELARNYHEELADHEAWVTLLAHISPGRRR